MPEGIISLQHSSTAKRKLRMEKLNTKVRTLKIYEICKNSFRYFLKVDGKAVKCFDTYEEAFDYAMELSNAD
jgi:hypothetical protein